MCLSKYSLSYLILLSTPPRGAFLCIVLKVAGLSHSHCCELRVEQFRLSPESGSRLVSGVRGRFRPVSEYRNLTGLMAKTVRGLARRQAPEPDAVIEALPACRCGEELPVLSQSAGNRSCFYSYLGIRKHKGFVDLD